MIDAQRRQVYLTPNGPFEFGDYQMNYMNYRDWRIIPSTDIIVGGERHYLSNAYGCQGPEIVEGLPVVGVFGDSVIHGVAGDSFVHRMDLGRCQKLNGGVEGMVMSAIIDRVFEIDRQAPLVAAAVHGGWHNLLYNDRGEEYWTEQFDRLSVLEHLILAHFRLVCDFNEDGVRLGYDDVETRIDGYYLWSAIDYTTEAGRRAGMDAIERYNTFIEDYSRDRGRILIDLDPVLKPATHADLAKNFIDFIHPAPVAYDGMAQQVQKALEGPLRAKGLL